MRTKLTMGCFCSIIIGGLKQGCRFALTPGSCVRVIVQLWAHFRGGKIGEFAVRKGCEKLICLIQSGVFERMCNLSSSGNEILA